MDYSRLALSVLSKKDSAKLHLYEYKKPHRHSEAKEEWRKLTLELELWKADKRRREELKKKESESSTKEEAISTKEEAISSIEEAIAKNEEKIAKSEETIAKNKEAIATIELEMKRLAKISEDMGRLVPILKEESKKKSELKKRKAEEKRRRKKRIVYDQDGAKDKKSTETEPGLLREELRVLESDMVGEECKDDGESSETTTGLLIMCRFADDLFFI